MIRDTFSARPRLAPRPSRRAGLVAMATVLLGAVTATRGAQAAIVFFPVNSGGSISQPGTGQQPVYLQFGDINLGNGTFTTTTGTNPPNAPSFGIGLNPPEGPVAAQFFSQSNDGVAWLISSGTISLLPAGSSIGNAGTYSSLDPNFGGNWKAGVSPGYAGLQMTSGTDVYYGWTSITYVVGSPNQVTVNAFAFENQPNTPINAAAVPEPTGMATTAAVLGLVSAVALRRHRRRRSVQAAELS